MARGAAAVVAIEVVGVVRDGVGELLPGAHVELAGGALDLAAVLEGDYLGGVVLSDLVPVAVELLQVLVARERHRLAPGGHVGKLLRVVRVRGAAQREGRQQAGQRHGEQRLPPDVSVCAVDIHTSQLLSPPSSSLRQADDDRLTRGARYDAQAAVWPDLESGYRRLGRRGIAKSGRARNALVGGITKLGEGGAHVRQDSSKHQEDATPAPSPPPRR